MKRLLITYLILSLFACCSIAQGAGNFKTEKVFLDSDTTKNHYTIIFPSKLPLKGYLFLLPGFGESAERVMQQSLLPIQSASSGILTIIPTLQDGVLSFGIDDASQKSLQRIMAHVRGKNKLAGLPFFLGGYSIGGGSALKFAEEADIKPNAVFAIDPPIDFEQMYLSCKRNIRLAVNTLPTDETLFLVNKIEEIMHGTPEEAIANYHQISPYSISDHAQTAVKKLGQVPLRIYTEPDIAWWMKERGMDYTSMNSTFHSAMINELNKLGNQNATLITTQNKGYRKPDNSRHPHSWSIVDGDELIAWLFQQK